MWSSQEDVGLLWRRARQGLRKRCSQVPARPPVGSMKGHAHSGVGVCVPTSLVCKWGSFLSVPRVSAIVRVCKL